MRSKETIDGKRQCATCKKWKLIKEFNIDRGITDGLCTSCRSCISDRNKKNGRKVRYGITRAEYDILFEKQGGVCAICGEPEVCTIQGKVRELSLDHCHETGKVRGLLCMSCNNGLGRFKHNAIFLRKAAFYLDSY